MGLRDMFKRNPGNNPGINTGNNPIIPNFAGSDFFQRLSQPNNSNTDNIAKEEGKQILKKLKEKYLQEHRYAYILDRLLKHISKPREKLSGDRDYLIAQYNYDKSENAEIKKLMFIPYLQELEKLGYYDKDEIPDEIKEFYENYKRNKQAARYVGIKREKAFAVLQSMGIVNLKDENAFKQLDKAVRQMYIRKFEESEYKDLINREGILTEKDIPKELGISPDTEQLCR